MIRVSKVILSRHLLFYFWGLFCWIWTCFCWPIWYYQRAVWIVQRDYYMIFSFYTFDMPFFAQYRSKKSREKSYSWASRFLRQFINIKSSTLWNSLVKSSILHDHNTAVFIVESFLLEVISRSQLPRNTLKNCLGECIRAWISTTLASSKFFLLLFIWIKQQWKYSLNITVIMVFFTKLSEFGGLEVEILIEV